MNDDWEASPLDPNDLERRAAWAYFTPLPDPLESGQPAPNSIRATRRPTLATELYRLFNADGILLYVGITMQSAGGRLQQHADMKSWWHLVTDVRIQREPTRCHGGFERDEMEAILNEFPMFNIRGVPWRERRPKGGNSTFDQMRNRAEIVGAVARLDDLGVVGRLEVHEQIAPKSFEIQRRAAARRIERGGTALSWDCETLVRLEDLYFQRALGERQWQDFNTSGERARLEAELAQEVAARRRGRYDGGEATMFVKPAEGRTDA